MRLRDILDMPNFHDLEVIAGHNGLDKEVDTVTVMDAPDIENWMKGKEFLISTAYVFKDSPEILEEKLIKLDQKNVSGFGIKLDRFLMELPEEVIDKANELNFPIIYIPNRYPFIDIINPVLTRIVNEQADKLIKSESIHNSFTDLVIRGEGTERILETLSDFIKIDCLFIDKIFLKKFYSSKNNEFYRNTIDLKTEDILTKYKAITVKLNNKIFGYLVFEKDISFDEKISYGKIAIDHALTVLRLDQRRKITKNQVEEKFRDKFIRDLLYNNIDSIEEAIQQARIYNWTFHKNYNVLDLSIDDYDLHLKGNNDFNKIDYLQDELLNYINNEIKNIFPDFIYTTMRSSIIYLLDLDGNEESLSEIKKAIKNFNNNLKEEYNFKFTLGVGEQVDNLYDVNKSFQQARKTIDLSKKLNEDRNIYYYKNLKYYKILDQIKNKQLVNGFIEENISKINDYDKNNNSNLLLTLKKYINNNWNISKTAEEMFLHYNTIKLRIKKIEEVTGLDLSDSDTRFNLSLALKLLNINKF